MTTHTVEEMQQAYRDTLQEDWTSNESQRELHGT